MNMIKKKLIGGMSYVTFTFLLALYFTVVVNLPVYKALIGIFSQLETVKLGFVLTIPLFFLAFLNFLFSLFSWPKISKPFFIILLILSSMVSYAGFNYGVMFDYDMIINIMETDSSEASSYLSLYSVIWTLLIGVIPALIVYKLPIKPITNPIIFITAKLVSMFISLVMVGLIAAAYYQDYASVGRNNSYLKKVIIPTQFVYSTSQYVKDTYFTTPQPYKQIGLDAKQSDATLAQAQTKPTLMIMVVGETARAQNYELNGYHRNTNPYTRELDMISFQDVTACGTATAVSVPCMFANMTRDNFNRSQADNQDNLLDILQRANVSQLWKENDGGDKSVAKNITKIEIDRSRKDDMCNGSTCYDMALLENIEQDIADLKGNRMITLHLIGSHGPTYYQRYPSNKAIFQPDCPRADIENCSQEQIINSYDNTILYTDYVISQMIDKLKQLDEQYNTALVYISDHGESLGENGTYLHGIPYRFAPEYQTKVPLMVWMSPSFQQTKNIDYTCLKQAARKTGTYSHDNIFHSMLGVMDVSTQEYQAQLDIFSQCRNKFATEVTKNNN
ncbi:phosphoethanolamine transferase [Photobacterium leiognathi]|uniref:phosphoethanolamine transferase n=1 Tax=Photobacterium leiognathi TaxID=553611 RepID=UPI00273A43D2|nr:phosphoethanolamine--lipid A transferase [Photobacterium leiognathi]